MISLLSSSFAVGARAPAFAMASSGSGAQFEIAMARANSANVNAANAESRAHNAEGIKHFAEKGLTMKLSSCSQDYKEQVVKSVDRDSDQLISRAELAAQVGDAATDDAVSKLYAALDADGDGSVSAQELSDGLPDPSQLPAFRSQLVKLTEHGNADPAAIGALYRKQFAQYDASTVLGGLASRIDVMG